MDDYYIVDEASEIDSDSSGYGGVASRARTQSIIETRLQSARTARATVLNCGVFLLLQRH